MVSSDFIAKDNALASRCSRSRGWPARSSGARSASGPSASFPAPRPQIVDRLEYVAEAGCDGCLLSWPEWEKGLAQFEREVMPLLEQAGPREPYVPDSIGATA